MRKKDISVLDDFAIRACKNGTKAPPENPIRKILLAMKCFSVGSCFVCMEKIHGYMYEFIRPSKVNQ